MELAIVLSMQILGGEPQAAYLLGVASIGYAAAWPGLEAIEEREHLAGAKPAAAAVRVVPGSWRPFALVLWFWRPLRWHEWLPRLRDPACRPPPLRWMPWVPAGVIVAWGLVAIGFLVHWRRRGWRYPLGAMWLGLASSATLAAALSAAQLFPVIEFTQQTGRPPHAESG